MKDNKNQDADPIQQSVHVDCPLDDAFRLFTEGFGKWWPLAPTSRSGSDAQTCEMEPGVDGRILERSPSGVEREWGVVTEWNPPGKLEFTWNPGGPKDDRQAVSVEFQKEEGGTRVTLTHRGWHLAGVAVCVAGAGGTASKTIQGLGICWAPNWKPVAIGRQIDGAEGSAVALGSGNREAAWRTAARPTWAEVFVNCFAAFVDEHAPAAV
jgi:uncharacterized protein YndB with AHSA1/START domain